MVRISPLLVGLGLLFSCLDPGSAAARDVVRLPVPYMQQPDGSTCLPTSLVMAMHFMGRCDLTTETVFALHKDCRYDRYNTPAIAARYGLHAFPSWLERAWTRETVEAELRAGRPVVLGLDCTRPGHFVLAVGYTDDAKVIIHDPYWKEGEYPFGGAFHTTPWEPLIWRGGIMLRGEPFPEAPRSVSGKLVDTTHPRTMLPGQVDVAEFAIRNNGREPWPDEIYLAPVDAYTTAPVRDRHSPFALLAGGEAATSETGTWVSVTRAAVPDRKNLPPGEVAVFRVPLKAPSVGGPTTFRENWNLVDGQGRWFSEHWQTGPSDREIFFRLAVVPRQPGADRFPLIETAEAGRPSLPWRCKFGTGESFLADASTTAPPEGLQALRFVTPGQKYDMAFVGDPLASDYRAEAWVYCDYRPERKGYERVGIFVRDSGQHSVIPKTELESGECLVMGYDSDDGRIRMGNFADGALADYRRREGRILIKESGWHKFGISASGTSVTFELDGVPVHTVAKATPRDEELRGRPLSAGDCGVFYKGVLEQSVPGGVAFAGFRADLLPVRESQESVPAPADAPAVAQAPRP